MPRLDDDEAMTDDDNEELDDLMKTLPEVSIRDSNSGYNGSSSLPQFDGVDIRKLVEALASNPLRKSNSSLGKLVRNYVGCVLDRKLELRLFKSNLS